MFKKSIQHHQYQLKNKKYKKVLRNFRKNRYVYVPNIDNVVVGCKLYLKNEYYGTVVAVSKRLIYVNNDVKPMDIPNPFLKENFYQKNFKVQF